MMATAVWALAVVAFSCTLSADSASIGADSTLVDAGHRLPVYDDGFMRKLCSFLGASYVRSSKDPQCWYTWCHAGEPYHMQCPPGRSVSPHFYWSSKDPCTEADGQEKCLVGFLKNMHKDAPEDEVKVDKVAEAPQLNDKRRPVEEKQAPVYEGIEPVEEPLEVTPIVYKEEPQGEVLGQESDPKTNEEEPIPEPEPTPELTRKEPEVVVKRVEQGQDKGGVYYPAHRQSYVVDSFTPKDSPYGYFPNYNNYYRHYSQPTYFQKLPSSGIQEPKAEYQNSADEEAPVVYKQPEAKQAPLLQPDPNGLEEELPQEPLYDAEYIGIDYPESTYNREEEDYGNEEQLGTEEQPEYEYVDQKQLSATEEPLSEVVTEPSQVRVSRDEEGEKEEETEEQVDEDTVDAEGNGGEKDPMLYDYFKTHFVEIM